MGKNKNYVYQHSFFLSWIMFFLGTWLNSTIIFVLELDMSLIKKVLIGSLISLSLVFFWYILLMSNKNIKWDDDQDEDD